MFPIGVWAQPNGSAAKWKSRGINTLITPGPKPDHLNLPRELYADEWVDNGLQVFMAPTYIPKTDRALPSLAGFTQPDEADLMPHLLRNSDGSYDVRRSIDMYVAAYHSLKSALPAYPVFGNFAGPDLTGVGDNVTAGNPRRAQDYRDFFGGADILSADWYIANTGRPYSAMTAILGKMIDRLVAWGGGKPVWACLECSNQKVNAAGRCPTPEEFKAQVWQCILRGARGIWYFPYELAGHGGTFNFDATPPEIVAAMTETNALLQRFAPYFLNGIRTPIDAGPGGPTVVEAMDWELNGRHLQIQLVKLNLNTTWKEDSQATLVVHPIEVRLKWADGMESVYVPK